MTAALDRQAALAAALRANLKRRKAAARSAEPAPPAGHAPTDAEAPQAPPKRPG